MRGLQPEEPRQACGAGRQGGPCTGRPAYPRSLLTLSPVQIFEQPSKITIGLERHILQTIGFDFRVRYPQKLLCKVVRRVIPPDDGKAFMGIAYPMCIDIYKTFSPIKQTTATMVMSIVELTARIMDRHVEAVRALDLHDYDTNRGCVIESMLDLLDLYATTPKCTKVGMAFDLARIIGIKIKINEEVDENPELSRFKSWCDRCEIDDREGNPITPGSATSPATTGSWPTGISSMRHLRNQDSTMRFLFDAGRARREREVVDEYFMEEYDEYEIEVDEPVPEPRNNHHGPAPHQHAHRPGSRRERGGHNGYDPGWGGPPYHRGGRHHGHNERPRGNRKGPPYF